MSRVRLGALILKTQKQSQSSKSNEDPIQEDTFLSQLVYSLNSCNWVST